MWINNYDDPEEMDLQTALKLLQANGYTNCTTEANKQNGTGTMYVFNDPSGEGVHYCDGEEEVIELVISQELTFPESQEG